MRDNKKKPTIKDLICEELKIDRNIYIEEVKDEISPYYDGNKIVLVTTGEDWKTTYQMSHELMHVAFDKYNNPNKLNTIWIEEIVCEAFSLYCLKKYRGRGIDSIKWSGYFKKDFYIKNNNIASPASPKTIEELNDLLSGYKEYDTLQFIHPYVLKIEKIIENDIGALIEFEDLAQFCKTNEITNNTDNEIAKVILKIQTQIEGTKHYGNTRKEN